MVGQMLFITPSLMRMMVLFCTMSYPANLCISYLHLLSDYILVHLLSIVHNSHKILFFLLLSFLLCLTHLHFCHFIISQISFILVCSLSHVGLINTNPTPPPLDHLRLSRALIFPLTFLFF